MRFLKGHGTENDFVLLPDHDDRLDLTPHLVRALCDRRTGIGADGVLRVVRRDGGWFMDYRNADGSLAEMCGNGVRVFARYLVDAGLAPPGELRVGTLAGTRTVRLGATGDVTVDMGVPELLDTAPTVGPLTGTAVSMGNPHVVVALPPGADTADLAAVDLSRPPAVEPVRFTDRNVEFVLRRGPRRLAMRVYERGVGETRSCGTGACAAVVATVATGGSGRGERWLADLPGGRLEVEWTEAGTVLLTGPAVLVAEGEAHVTAGTPPSDTASP